MNYGNVVAIAAIAMLVSTTAIAQQSFDCVDIHNNHIYTGSDGTFDKNLGVGYGTFIYKHTNVEINVLNSEFSDGFYYGNVYTSKDYKQYYDIKCKKVKSDD